MRNLTSAVASGGSMVAFAQETADAAKAWDETALDTSPDAVHTFLNGGHDAPLRTRVTRVAAALVALAALPGLAACTPASLPLTAVRAVDGKPVVLLASCPDFAIETLTVSTSTFDRTATVDGPDWRVRRVGAEVPNPMPLLGRPPAGWTVQEDELTELAPNQPYSLSGYANRHLVSIQFTAADLTALGPDEVLIGTTRSGHEKVTEQEFRKRAKDACPKAHGRPGTTRSQPPG